MTGSPPAIEVDHLSIAFGDVVAIDDLTMTFDAGMIHGLLGRNGAGKSSLLAAIAAFRKGASGEVRIGGEAVFENPRRARQVCLIRESGDTVPDDEKVEAALKFAAAMRPNWDRTLAASLLDRLELSLRSKVGALSRGKRSALGVVLGLAARAPVTIFDESYLGMDAPSRYAFYDVLLDDVVEHPRTVIVSTHLIEEVNAIFERVAIIESGRLLVQDDADTLRARGASVIGAGEIVDRFVARTPDVKVLSTSSLGRTKSVTLYGEFDERWRREAYDDGLEVGPISLQDLFVHLTGQSRS